MACRSGVGVVERMVDLVDSIFRDCCVSFSRVAKDFTKKKKGAKAGLLSPVEELV